MQKFTQNIAVVYIMILMIVKMIAAPLLCFDYSIRKDFIAATYCVNKDKPELQCFGQCHLKKQLEKTNESGESQTQKSNTQHPSIDFFEENETISFELNTDDHLPLSAQFLSTITTGYPGDVFHPPLFA
ncbi:MAG: hypothetical protein EOO02_14605 [Chitinophagaceae bacterium]|nr:MAG: hypothetical protein EOO02_14605 [Chitinophagaceae bacterium]